MSVIAACVCCVFPLNTENEVPELVQVLKKWFPQPNGHYHLQAKFYINNFIRGITLFYADYTLPGFLGFVDVSFCV